MNSRERSVAAMRGLTPDRVPVMPLIDTSYAVRCMFRAGPEAPSTNSGPMGRPLAKVARQNPKI